MISPYKSSEFRITSPVGWRVNPITGSGKQAHYGLDCVSCGDDTVVAVKSGKVVRSRIVTNKLDATWQWGNYVAITDSDGYTIYYCHMSARFVSVGDTVAEGQSIGREGATGAVTGKHLHIELRRGNEKCNLDGGLTNCNIAAVLGVTNAVGRYKASEWPSEAKSNIYSRSGFTFVLASNFKVVYADKAKRSAVEYGNVVNGGFFGNYKSSDKLFTLPAANLCCDIDVAKLSDTARKYISRFYFDGKLRISCGQNASEQFRGKAVSTLIVPESGKPYIADVGELPSGCKYAISGVPTVRNKGDVDYYGYVKAQGWDESCMYAAWRTFLGVKDGQIWIITGKTTTANYIYGCEMWKILAREAFDDVIAIDGGGSYFWRYNGKAKATSGNRQINNVITF